MTLTPLSLRRRLRRRFSRLPIATNVMHVCSIWVRTNGRLACKVCGLACKVCGKP